VDPAHRAVTGISVPKKAIAIRVSSEGFSPSSIRIPAHQPTQLAFTRADAQNCAREVVFPALGIRKELPPGQPVVIDIPARDAGELHFACGMGMFRGALVVK
jgi:plastocyanin domain-containing protein